MCFPAAAVAVNSYRYLSFVVFSMPQKIRGARSGLYLNEFLFQFFFSNLAKLMEQDAHRSKLLSHIEHSTEVLRTLTGFYNYTLDQA